MELHMTVMEIDVKRAYVSVVGDLINRLTRSVRFADGTMTVSLASAALRQELWQRRESLAGRINDIVGKTVVKKIVFM